MERVVAAANPDSVQIEELKKMLKVRDLASCSSLSLHALYSINNKCNLPSKMQEQEQALVDIIAKLDEASDGESGNN